MQKYILYKPAKNRTDDDQSSKNDEIVGTNHLQQGHLVMNVCNTQETTASFLTQNGSSAKSPRQKLHSFKSCDIVDLVDPAASPRTAPSPLTKDANQIIVEQTDANSSLELSETEVNVSPDNKKETKDVMVVEAQNDKGRLGFSELPVRTELISSPAKVIAHKSMPANSNSVTEETRASIPVPFLKTKKKGKVVPSRYKQAASTFKKSEKHQISAMDAIGMKDRLIQPSKTRHSAHFHITPNVKDKTKPMSTPATGKSAALLNTIDVSSIVEDVTEQDHKSVLSTESAKEKDGTAKKKGLFKPQKGPSLEEKQRHLLITYTRYVQSLYMNNMMFESMRNQEDQAVNDMITIWEENERLKKYKAQLDIMQAKLQHMQLLDKHLLTQNESLENVLPVLDSLQDSYIQLSSSLERTLHHMPVKNVALPTNMGDLTLCLNETKQRLNDLQTITASNNDPLSDLSHHLRILDECVQEESTNVDSCNRLIRTAVSLTAQESSLKLT